MAHASKTSSCKMIRNNKFTQKDQTFNDFPRKSLKHWPLNKKKSRWNRWSLQWKYFCGSIPTRKNKKTLEFSCLVLKPRFYREDNFFLKTTVTWSVYTYVYYHNKWYNVYYKLYYLFIVIMYILIMKKLTGRKE